MRRSLVSGVILLSGVLLLCGTLSAAPPDRPAIRWVAAAHVEGADGATVYRAYCAACHGPIGRGNGPAVPFLSRTVPDLSTLAERDGGFQLLHVKMHIVGGAHSGSDLMLPWKSILEGNYHSAGFADLAALNLAKHIQTLQVTTAPR